MKEQYLIDCGGIPGPAVEAPVNTDIKEKMNMKKQNENLTELVFILDRSGSMQGLEADTVGGFNSLLAKQKAQEGK